jgi:outer membrane immunogenic protein
MSLRRSVIAFAACLAVSGASGARAQVFGTGPWTGLYIGAHGGHGWTSASDMDLTGWAGGIQAGYNLQLGPAVIGFEADYTWTGLDGTSRVSNLPLSGNVDSLWSVRGRLGYSIANSVMIYGTAGYGGFDTSVRTVISGIGLKGSTSIAAVVVGGGAELLLTPSIMLRLEGLRYIGDGQSWTTGGDGDVTLLRAGVSYKF